MKQDIGCRMVIMAWLSVRISLAESTAYYDWFRVENGRIAEHWNMTETITDKFTWQD